MHRKLKWTGLALAAAAALATLPALAQQPGQPHGLPGRPPKGGDVKEARGDVKDAKKDLRDARKDADASAADREAARGDLKKAREELRATRQDRRKEHLEALQKKYGGDFLQKGAVVAERRIHARRLARLNFMLRFAKETKKDALVPRIEAALKKEQERHDKRMEKLKTTNGEDTAAPAASGGAK